MKIIARAPRSAVDCLFLTTSLWTAATTQEAERTVTIGDVHGDYDNFVAVLEQPGIVNGRGN